MAHSGGQVHWEVSAATQVPALNGFRRMEVRVAGDIGPRDCFLIVSPFVGDWSSELEAN